jgi:mRNA interferase MazF
MIFQRGHIYRIDLEPTRGSEQQGNARPCVVLSITPLNKKFRTIGVVPLSSSAMALPPVVIAVPSAGQGNSVALIHQFRTIDKARVGKAMGELSSEDMQAIEDGMRQVYGLN